MKRKLIIFCMMLFIFGYGFAVQPVGQLTPEQQNILQEKLNALKQSPAPEESRSSNTSTETANTQPAESQPAPSAEEATKCPPSSTGDSSVNALPICSTPCNDISQNPQNYQTRKGIGVIRISDLCRCEAPQSGTQPSTFHLTY